MAISSWRNIFFRAAGFGVGFAVTLLLGIATWSYFSSLPKEPKPWNTNAIKSTFSELTVSTGDRLVANFQYILENTTPYDYNLPTDIEAAFIQLPKTKGLIKDHEISWDKGAFVPKDQKIAVTINLTYDYSEYSFSQNEIADLEKLSQFMNNRLREIDGFVILDKQTSYQINFAKGWSDDKTKKAKPLSD